MPPMCMSPGKFFVTYVALVFFGSFFLEFVKALARRWKARRPRSRELPDSCELAELRKANKGLRDELVRQRVKARAN